MLPGRAVARTGLRMMPTSPPLPLKSRTVSFPQYGFKAGMSDGAFPAPTRSSRPLVCHRPSCSPLASSVPRSVPRDETRWNTSVRASSAALPQGPSLRSGYSVPVHPHLFGPMRPTGRHISTSPPAVYTRCPRCASKPSTPRRPTSGSVLSLTIRYRHVAL